MANVFEEARRYQSAAEAGVEDALRATLQGIARLLPDLVTQAEAAAARVAAMTTAGGSAGNAQVFAVVRSRAIAQGFEQELRRLLTQLEPAILNGEQSAVEVGLMAARRLTEGELPPGLTLADLERFGREWTTPPVNVVRTALAQQRSAPVAKLLDAIGEDAGRTARDVLNAGLASGKSPRAVGRALVAATDLAAARAELLARDQMLRAYRESSLASYRANPGIVKKFRRLCAHQARTCVMCLALDNKEQDTDALMPVHPADRCTVTPVTVSWADLGLDVPEAPPQPRQTGAQWLAAQDEATQVAVLGKGGLSAYRQGAALTDFVRIHDDPDWGLTLRRARLSEVS